MELAGLILIGIGVNSFTNGVWLLLYNHQKKRIDELEKSIKNIQNNIHKLITGDK